MVLVAHWAPSTTLAIIKIKQRCRTAKTFVYALKDSKECETIKEILNIG